MNKNKLANIIFVAFICGSILSACDLHKSEKINTVDKPTANQKVGKVLPFKVCNIQNNHAFNGGFSILDADIRVDSGSSNDWVATGIAIAKKLGELGISTDVKLTIYRSDLGKLDNKQTRNRYKWLTRIDYGVDSNHSLNTSSGGKQWLISYATDSSVVTPKDIQIEQEYQELMRKYNNPPIDNEIVAIIKKKYNISGEFNLPLMNLSENTNNPNDYFIDASGQEDRLKKLKADFKELPKNRRQSNIECSI